MHRLGIAARARLVHAGTVTATAGAATAYWFSGPDARTAVYTAVVALPLITFLLALITGHLRDRRPWIIAVLGLVVLLVQQMWLPGWIAGRHLGQAEGSIADVAASTAHALFLTGTAMSLRRRVSTDPGGIIDAALFGLCCGGPLWVWLVQPNLPAGVSAAGQMLLLTDLLVLCAVAAGLFRIRRVGRPGRASLGYLLLTALLTLAGNVTATLEPGTVWSAELLVGAYLTLAAAPIHPSAPAITRPLPATGVVIGRPRLGWLAAALSVNPLIATVQEMRGQTSASLLLPIGTLLVIPLVVLRIRQLTAQRDRAERTLAHHASHDELTGLYNRRHITAAIDHALAEGDREFAVLLCDLDRFKPVNDEYGHPAGDEVLRVIATRLTGTVRAGDLVGRLGGDEFVVLCPGATAAESEELTARITAAVREPIRVPGGVVAVGVTIGAAQARPGVPVDRDTLVGRADAAMYAGKAAARAGHP